MGHLERPKKYQVMQAAPETIMAGARRITAVVVYLVF